MQAENQRLVASRQANRVDSYQDMALGLVSTRSFPAIVGTADMMLKTQSSTKPATATTYYRQNTSTATRSSKLSSETVEQVRNILAGGYKIGTEHVDQRRFRTGSWQSCSPIDTRSESEAIAALEECVANHAGEYIRLFGIEPKARKRVLETIIQRPSQ